MFPCQAHIVKTSSPGREADTSKERPEHGDTSGGRVLDVRKAIELGREWGGASPFAFVLTIDPVKGFRLLDEF